MNIRFFIIMLIGTLLLSCSGNQGMIHHVVLVWFNGNVPEGYSEKVIEETLKLGSIPEVQRISAGKAIPSERAIVDDTFHRVWCL